MGYTAPAGGAIGLRLALVCAALVAAPMGLAAQTTDSAPNNPGDESIPQELEYANELVSRFDSLVEDYQEPFRTPTRADTQKLNKYRFEPHEVPHYHPAELENRLNMIPSEVALDYNPIVQKFIDFYTRRYRKHTGKMLGLSQVYFPLFEKALAKHQAPLVLKHLPIIESALNPYARSWAGAEGIWQFMYSTARNYGLRIDSYIDERLDPELSADAAARLLTDLYDIYNNWHLALAAYNCGPGCVNRAIRMARGDTNFWAIARYLPRETRYYVPNFIAVVYALYYPAEHNIYPLYANFHFQYDQIEVVNKQVTLAAIADKTGASLKDLKRLNPALKQAMIPRSTQPVNLRLPDTLITWAYTTQLKNLNGPSPKFQETDANKATGVGLAEDGVLMYHTVSRGESTRSIAERFGVSENQVIAWNQLSGYGLSPGYTIKLYVEPELAAQDRTYQSFPPPLAKDPLLRTATGADDYLPVRKVGEPDPRRNLVSPADTLQPNPRAQNDALLKQAMEKPKAPQAAAIDTFQLYPLVTPYSPLHEDRKHWYHRLLPQENLLDVANRYEWLSLSNLLQLNRLSETQALQPGTVLRVK